MLVKDGNSMLVFVSNGREDGNYTFDFPNETVADEELDKALILIAAKGFVEDAPKEETSDSIYVN